MGEGWRGNEAKRNDLANQNPGGGACRRRSVNRLLNDEETYTALCYLSALYSFVILLFDNAGAYCAGVLPQAASKQKCSVSFFNDLLELAAKPLDFYLIYRLYKDRDNR